MRATVPEKARSAPLLLQDGARRARLAAGMERGGQG